MPAIGNASGNPYLPTILGREAPIPVSDFILRYKMDALDLADGVNTPTQITGISKPEFQAISFNGIDQYLDKGADSSIVNGIQASFSFTMWLNISPFGNYGLISQGGVGVGGSGFRMQALGSGNVRFRSNNLNSNSADTINLGLWTHVAFTYNGTDLLIYINAVPDSGNPYTVTMNVFSSGTFKIGTSSGASSLFINGGIDDIRAYDRPLSQSEITSIYNYR
jgi:hypothetical protein